MIFELCHWIDVQPKKVRPLPENGSLARARALPPRPFLSFSLSVVVSPFNRGQALQEEKEKGRFEKAPFTFFFLLVSLAVFLIAGVWR